MNITIRDIVKKLPILDGRLMPNMAGTKEPHRINGKVVQYKIDDFLLNYPNPYAVAIKTGNGLLAIDVDGKEQLKKAQELFGEDPFGKTIKTTSGKEDRFVAWYKYDPQIKLCGCDIDGLEFKINSNQTIFGMHKDNLQYHFVEGYGLDDVELAEVPENILNFLKKKVYEKNQYKQSINTNKPKITNPEIEVDLERILSVKNKERLKSIVENRNVNLHAFGLDALGCEYWINQRGYKLISKTAYDLFKQANLNCSKGPLDDIELKNIWDSILKSNPRPSIAEYILEEIVKNPPRQKSTYTYLKPVNHKEENSENNLKVSEDKEIEDDEQEKLPEVPQFINNKNNRVIEHNGRFGHWIMKNELKTERDPETGKEIQSASKQIKVPHFEYLTDYKFDIVNILDDLSGEGNSALELKMKQVSKKRTVNVILMDKDKHDTRTLSRALSKGYGGVLFDKLNHHQYNDIIDTKIQQFIEQGGKPKTLATCRGKQDNGYWIFENIQFDSNGDVCTEEKSGLVFNPIQIDGDAIPSPNILKPDSEILGKVMKLTAEYAGSAIYPTLLLIAAQIMGVHYKERVESSTTFPLVNAIGMLHTGKTTAALIGQALVGLYKITNAQISTISESALFERAKTLSGISIWVDDPQKDENFSKNLLGLTNNGARVVRGNSQKPCSGTIITSNHALGEDNSAVVSRTIYIPFKKVKNINIEAFDELQKILHLASGAFNTFIKWGYDKESIYKLKKEFQEYLPTAVDRVALNIANLAYYAFKLAPYAGISEQDLKNYIIETICRDADQLQTEDNFLIDFLKKLETLREKNLIGPWNYKFISKRGIGENVLAIKLDSVWSVFSKEYEKKTSYNLTIIKSLLDINFTKKNAKHIFVDDIKSYQLWVQKMISEQTYSIKTEIGTSFCKRFNCIEIYVDRIPEMVGFYDNDISLEDHENNNRKVVSIIKNKSDEDILFEKLNKIDNEKDFINLTKNYDDFGNNPLVVKVFNKLDNKKVQFFAQTLIKIGNTTWKA
jgi:hypothetical protein